MISIFFEIKKHTIKKYILKEIEEDFTYRHEIIQLKNKTFQNLDDLDFNRLNNVSKTIVSKYLYPNPYMTDIDGLNHATKIVAEVVLKVALNLKEEE